MSQAPKCLVVVAHADDEILGCGASLHKLGREGWECRMALACNDVDKRSRRPTLVERDRDMQAVCRIVGPEPAYLGTFDNLLLAQSLQHESVEFEENNHPDFQPELACVHAVRDMSQCGAARLKASFAAMRIFREQKTASGSFSTNVCYQNLKFDVPCIQKSY